MKKGMIITLLAAIVCTSAVAAEFGTDSADINGAYLFTAAGSQMSIGYGSKEFQYEYVHNNGFEVVDGVRCIRAVSISTQSSEFTEYWIAQDVVGDIYLLKYWQGEEYVPVIIGRVQAELMMRRNPQVGDLILRDKAVIETGVFIDQLPTGLGPFEDCVVAVGPGGDTTYFAPDFGMIAKVHPGENSGWLLGKVNYASSKVQSLPKAPSRLKLYGD